MNEKIKAVEKEKALLEQKIEKNKEKRQKLKEET